MGRDWTGRDRAGQGVAGQGVAGQGRAGLDRAGQGRGIIRIVIRPQGGTRELEVDPDETFRIDRALRQSIKAMPGVVDVAEI